MTGLLLIPLRHPGLEVLFSLKNQANSQLPVNTGLENAFRFMESVPRRAMMMRRVQGNELERGGMQGIFSLYERSYKKL